MNLKIENVLPYLPYGLIWQRFIDKPMVGEPRYVTMPNPRIIIGHDSEFSVMKDRDNGYDLKLLKPILRPLKDTQTLEVDFNGEEGIFKDNFFGFTNFQAYYNEYLEYGQSYWHNRAPYVVVKRLLEYHFDVFGLIEDELAVDINTLEKLTKIYDYGNV